MELGLFGFIVLVIAYFLFRPAVKNTVGMVNEGVSSLALEFKEPEKVTEMKRKFGCDDPNIKTMSDLLDWVNKRT
jgi:hypothetical protein